MSETTSPYITAPVEPADTTAGFSCGNHALDDYFARHAVANDAAGVGRTYVLRRGAADAFGLPAVLGFYTLSMAVAAAEQVARFVGAPLPKYAMPVALVGRLAVDTRAQRQRVGERLLLDALRRVFAAADIVGCIGVIVDAKDHRAERFYASYDFSTLEDTGWPRRMFLPIGTVRAALGA